MLTRYEIETIVEALGDYERKYKDVKLFERRLAKVNMLLDRFSEILNDYNDMENNYKDDPHIKYDYEKYR